MRHVMHFNRTYEEDISKYWLFYRLFFHFEIMIIVFNLLHTFFFLRINISFPHFHINWANLQSYFYAQHILHCIVWLGQRFLILINLNDQEKLQFLGISMYSYFSIIRCTCIFGVFLLHSTLLVERFCATIFSGSYHTKNMRYISIILIFILFICSLLCGISYHLSNHSYFHVIGAIGVNIITIVSNLYLRRINKSYFQSIRNIHGNYSLTERYQVTENIKLCDMIGCMTTSISLFNFIWAGCLFLDSLDLPIKYLNILSIILDLNTLTYSTVIPHTTSRFIPKWRREIRTRAKNIFSISLASSKIATNSTSIRNNFGKVVKSRENVIEHFHNLQKMWEESAA